MLLDSSAKKVEALVLCVDRDDDLGRKAAIRGPIIGEEENFKAAKALALADPEDSDTNAIFAAIKTKREAENLYNGVEVVTLTGDVDVGVKSDQKIGGQLAKVLAAYGPKGVILVTDGAEDEAVIPVIQSETKILSIKAVAVKSSQSLESAYFKIQDFFSRIGENPKQARIMFGLPGLLVLLIVVLSYLGIPIVEIILSLIGIYLIAKGFGYEEQLFSGLNDVKNSLLKGNIYKVFNVVAILIVVLALVSGYTQLRNNLDSMYEPGTIVPPSECVTISNSTQRVCANEGRPNGIQPSGIMSALMGWPELSFNFILFSPGGNALDLLLVAVSLVALGFVINDFLKKEYLKIKKYLYVFITAIIIKLMSNDVYWAILWLKADSNHIIAKVSREATAVSAAVRAQNLLLDLVLAAVALLVMHYLMKIVFFDYIARKRKLEAEYMGRELISSKGKKLGNVTKVVLAGDEVKGLNVKRKYYPIEDIHASGKVLIVGE